MKRTLFFSSLFILILFVANFFLPSYGFIGHSLNYYYELNYDKNNVVNIQQKEQNIVPVKNVQKKTKRLIKTKKKFLHNVENKAPAFFDEYLEISKDVKRGEINVQETGIQKDAKIIDLPDPIIRITKYNDPPGVADLNLSNLSSSAKANSIAVMSPDRSKIVYSVANLFPSENIVSSSMYLINLKSSGDIKENLKNAHEIMREREPILSTQDFSLTKTEFKTLVLVDWSSDSKKIAVKEKVGSVSEGIWQTNLWVYDFETKQKNKLNSVREAIRYWWKTNQNIDLIDYMWDIYPIGWDSKNPDRIVLYAYAYTSSAPKFLGTWSVDCKNERSELLSIDKTNFSVSSNGYSLRMFVRE